MLDREGFRPNVGIILVNSRNEVFWGKRIREHSWQFPQGGIKKGETPEQAMLRELEEETGYRAARMEDLGEFYSSPGMVTESYSLFRAHGLAKVSEGGGTESENITVHRVPLADMAARVAAWRVAGYAIDTKLLLLLAGSIVGE